MFGAVPTIDFVGQVELTIGNIQVIVSHGTIAAVSVESFLVQPIFYFANRDWRRLVWEIDEECQTVNFTLGGGVMALCLRRCRPI